MCVTFLCFVYRKRKHKDTEKVEKKSNNERSQPGEVTELSSERLNQNGIDDMQDGNTKVKKKKNADKHSREKKKKKK